MIRAFMDHVVRELALRASMVRDVCEFARSDWLDRPPTDEEIVAHGDAHGAWRRWAAWQWLAPLDQTVEVGLVYLDGDNLAAAHAKIREAHEKHSAECWRPVSVTGDPVRIPRP